MNTQVFIQHPKHYQLDEKIFYLDTYYPYYGGKNLKFNDFSRSILDLK
jgi:predicted nuclease of restriction endonuclease-like (RecB) superfamily